MIHHETTDVEMIAHVDDLFVVGWLKHTQDVYRGLADAVEMKNTYAGPKTGNSDVEYLGRPGWKFMETTSTPPPW